MSPEQSRASSSAANGRAQAFTHTNRTTEFYQYTDTPAGTYWSTQTGTTRQALLDHVGVPFADAKWFRGRETTVRASSRCPTSRAVDARTISRNVGRASVAERPPARAYSLAAADGSSPASTTEVYSFLDAHAE